MTKCFTILHIVLCITNTHLILITNSDELLLNVTVYLHECYSTSHCNYVLEAKNVVTQ
jgi:hypothetical protein